MPAAGGGAQGAAVGRSLPPGLAWEPACTHARPKARPAEPTACRFGLADVEAADFRQGSYEVAHYAPAVCGLAFGPPNLGQVVRFCQDLTARLQLHAGAGRVVFQYGPTPAERANSAVLLGAFLILCEGWPAGAVAGALEDEAVLKFPCSWARPEKAQPPVMSVRHCWDGLELAGRQGWIRLGAWEGATPGGAGLEAQLVDLGVSQYRRLALEYDASWLVPAAILVMADPMTVISDPNPSTCSSFGPRAAGAEDIPPLAADDLQPDSPGSTDSLDDLEVTGHVSLSMSPEEAAESKNERSPGLPQYVEDRNDRNSSLHSVCKDYQHAADLGPEEACRPEAPDFASLLLKHGVGLVVRANAGDEQGLAGIGGSYDPAAIRAQGIRHLDSFVKDTNGAIPPPQLILSFLREVADALAPEARAPPAAASCAPAVAVHCKGGFGRSMLLACLLVIHQYDVPGSALLAWARLVRPGAFTVPEQERFLCRFGCREDLHRHVGLAGAVPCRCCSVQ